MPTLLFSACDHGISHDISWLKDKYISINQRFTYLLSMSKSVGKLTSVCSIFEKYFFSRCFHWNIDIQECIIAYWKEKLRIMHWKSFRNFVFKYFIITKFFSSCFFEWSFFLSFAFTFRKSKCFSLQIKDVYDVNLWENFFGRSTAYSCRTNVFI